MMLADRDRVGGRRDAAKQRARLLAGERDDRLDLCILREPFCARQMERAARFVEAVIALAAPSQPLGSAVRVAHEEGRRVDQNAVAFSRFDLEPPDDRTRERISHRAPLRLIVTQSTIAVIRLDHQHLWPYALE